MSASETRAPANPHARHAMLTSRAALASVAVALLLLSFKGYAAWATDSVAMLGSLADTALDFAASLVTLFGVRFAAMPADRNHRFGHGKAEALVALFQVVLIIVAALARSDEHTSELQSLMRISYAVFFLKKQNNSINTTTNIN